MSRAGFLPSPIDPFVLLHCLYYFYEVWQDEVDKLYICLNSDIEQEVINNILELVKHPKIVFSYYPRVIGHGKAIDVMLSESTEENILLIEDDSIIFKKGIVDSYFKQIESGEFDLIGSPRISCDRKLAEDLCVEFGLDIYKWGDAGPNFWPCFLFIKRKHLLMTDRIFGNSHLGDTFVNTSIQLRRMKLKIKEIPQYHCSPDDFQNKENGVGIFDGECGYMHFGSLSSGIENTLLDGKQIPLKERTKNIDPVVLRADLTEMEKRELEKRVMWWQRAYDLNSNKFGEFGLVYRKAIENVIEKCGLSMDKITNQRKLYEEVINSD